MGRIYTKAQKRATKKYYAKFSILNLRIFPEMKDEIVKCSKEYGDSINTFCVEALRKHIEECNKKN